MEILRYQGAFGGEDITGSKMVSAIDSWFDSYYRHQVSQGEDPCQRIAYTVVSKLVRTVFAEMKTASDSPFVAGLLQTLEHPGRQWLQQTLLGGESYLKPVWDGSGFQFTVIPRNRILIFGRDSRGMPTDVGTVELSSQNGWYYTLLERRRVDENGYLTIENRLYKSKNQGFLGVEVPLTALGEYRDFLPSYTFAKPVGSVGLVQMKTPQLNCVDGSQEGVSLYAPAMGLIHAIDRNEFLLTGEFERSQSRVFASRDLLQQEALETNLFVGLDEEPETVGLTIFAPEIRHGAYLARKQEYLRNVEAVIGLQRGMLSDVNDAQRTATEISATQAEHLLTVLDFQRMYQKGAEDMVALCCQLGELYGLQATPGTVQIDWGNGVLYDEEKLWQEYKDMVQRGLLAPEVALGWRFNLPSDTEAERAYIRKKYM